MTLVVVLGHCHIGNTQIKSAGGGGTKTHIPFVYSEKKDSLLKNCRPM